MPAEECASCVPGSSTFALTICFFFGTPFFLHGAFVAAEKAGRAGLALHTRCRSEDRRERASGSTSSNAERDDVMRAVAERTRLEPSAAKSQGWQQELRQHSYVAQKAMNFEPTRMMFCCSGRPCVAQRNISLPRLVLVGEGAVIPMTRNVLNFCIRSNQFR